MPFFKGMKPFPAQVRRPTHITLDEARYHLMGIEDRLRATSLGGKERAALMLLRDGWKFHVERLTAQ